jgi:ribonuclease P protein component
METGFPCRGSDSGLKNGRDCRFPRKERLKGRDEIREVFNRKKGVSCPGARLLTHRNGLPYNRIAFTFSRKFGNAVERNYSRRLSREVYRNLRNELRKGYDLVLLVYPGRDVFSVRMEQLRELFFRAGLFNSSRTSAEGSPGNQE